MIRRRASPDGLPFRVYERRGARVYSIGLKGADGKWRWRLSCAASDAAAVATTRAKAVQRAHQPEVDAPPAAGTFAALSATWLKWQDDLPGASLERRAPSTLTENRRELRTLNLAIGHMPVRDLAAGDAYAYLDACLTATNDEGGPRPRAAKGNKEIALASVVLEWGVRRRWLDVNPWRGIRKLRTAVVARLVTPQEMALAVEVGRAMGGPQHVCALALRTAWLCVRRSVEVRGLTREQLGDDGIRWTAGKRRAGAVERVALITWTPDLRATVDEALAARRRPAAAELYVFGTQDGKQYTKGGWKATLAKLMSRCAEVAAQRRLPFEPFSLQDCRPMGVSTKLARGDVDTVDATLHTSSRMVGQVYDRRRVRVAKPAG